MIKSGIDQDALITMFAEASAKQGEALRKAVSNATLQALQGRELTLESIRKVVKTIAGAASAGRGPQPGERRSTSRRCSARRSPASTRRCCRRSRPTARRSQQFVSTASA